jgi:NAD(P)H-nitrite reductase large subunit
MKKYVIIGNSAAAIGCVEAIRKLDQQGEITIITDEPYHTYSRPLISYWLGGKVADEKIYYRDQGFYEDNHVTLLAGRRAVGIDTKKRAVTLDDGGEPGSVPFDKLLIATGSRPFVPPTPGLETVPYAYTFMHWDSAKAIKERVDAGAKKVLIIGAGLIGLKAAEALIDMKRDLSVTIVDMANKVMPSVLDEAASDMVKAHIEKQGAVFKLGTVVERYEGNTAYLKNGEALDFDLLITAVGVRPNTSLAAEAGAFVDIGIRTDENQKTSLPDIYAAGDCTQSFDITSGKEKIMAILPNAYMQGLIAGYNMAGWQTPYKNALPMNAIGFFGLHIISAGDSLASGSNVYINKTYDDQDNVTDYKKMVFGEGFLSGYILVGDVSRAGIYTSIIAERVPVSKVDFELLKNKPQLMMFGREYRDEKLGGYHA